MPAGTGVRASKLRTERRESPKSRGGSLPSLGRMSKRELTPHGRFMKDSCAGRLITREEASGKAKIAAQFAHIALFRPLISQHYNEYGDEATALVPQLALHDLD